MGDTIQISTVTHVVDRKQETALQECYRKGVGTTLWIRFYGVGIYQWK